MESLKAKLFLNGKIETITGLHIGGSPTAYNISEIETNVIKMPNGIPFIPASSLKGKLRALYGSSKGYLGISRPKDDTNPNNHYDDEDPLMKRLFGTGITEGGEKGRIIIRDSYLDMEDYNKRKKNDFIDLEFDYTEGKWENSIGRIDSKSIPRQIERVPAGIKFNFQFILNLFDETDIDCLEVLLTSLRLLQDDYIGGNGSRGYGNIKFIFRNILLKTIDNYVSEDSHIEIKSEINLKTKNETLFAELKSLLIK